ncbi:hypothetical protein [Vibrio vulnificus]|uniref:hypothetical protein n=1 Tax=Vibrio vulnificus TaxID=672 RepID=UPI003EDB3984
MRKCAILIAGPSRYINSTIGQLERYSSEYSFEAFVFLWSEDSGNKIREQEEEFNPKMDRPYCEIKFITYAQPYSQSDYDNIFITKTEKGQSPSSSIMGMFNSMRILTAQLEATIEEYDLVLRIRTDCALISDDFFKRSMLKSGVLNVSKNYLIPHAWVSDHIMLGTKSDMIKLWKWSSNEDLFNCYKKNDMNPEKLLAYKVKKEGLKVKELWVRYRDYHIVYFPIKNTEPNAYNICISQRSVGYFYKNIKKVYDSNRFEIENMIAKMKVNQDYYAKHKIIKAFIRIKKFLSK